MKKSNIKLNDGDIVSVDTDSVISEGITVHILRKCTVTIKNELTNTENTLIVVGATIKDAIADAGIEKVEQTGSSSDAVFRFNDGQLQFFGLPAGESVSVYDLNGHHVAMQKQAEDDTVLCITLNSRGVLVIRTSNGISYKVSIP